MIVVADTSPLNHLIQIECDQLLAMLYNRIIIPPLVVQELSHPGAPPSVQRWAAHLPKWIEVQPLLQAPDPGLNRLDPGEREAIQLAEEQHAQWLLIDELLGREEAERRGLKVKGTLGVLLDAQELKAFDPRAAYARLLRETTFRISKAVEATFLKRLKP